MSDFRSRTMWLVHVTVGLIWSARAPRRDERGLSQSTEQAIIIAGAVAIALVIVAFVTTYVRGKLAEVGGP